jgi:hypothetical protein
VIVNKKLAILETKFGCHADKRSGKPFFSPGAAPGRVQMKSGIPGGMDLA